jgi:hypothetical protein
MRLMSIEAELLAELLARCPSNAASLFQVCLELLGLVLVLVHALVVNGSSLSSIRSRMA